MGSEPQQFTAKAPFSWIEKNTTSENVLRSCIFLGGPLENDGFPFDFPLKGPTKQGSRASKRDRRATAIGGEVHLLQPLGFSAADGVYHGIADGELCRAPLTSESSETGACGWFGVGKMSVSFC